MASIVKSFMGSPAVAAVAEVKIEGKPYVAAKAAKRAVEAGYTVYLSQTELDWIISCLGIQNSVFPNGVNTLPLFQKLEPFGGPDRRWAVVNPDGYSTYIPA